MLAPLVSLACQTKDSATPASAQTPANAGNITLFDVNGNPLQPLATNESQKATVLIFVAAECPICNAYAGEINRLNQSYAPRGVRFFLVDVDGDLTAETLRKHAGEYSLLPPVLMDPKRDLARKFAAKTTPETIVLGSSEQVVYRGRIDDLYVSLGQRRYEPTEHDLRDALDAVLADQPVRVKMTMPVGCAM
jgi:thiol-disulfide isomerase/thioredoxin